MTGTLVSDFSITISHRRWACVLDSALALSVYGLPLVKQLGELVELWVVREFWHLLDNTEFYQKQPERLLGQRGEGLASQEQPPLQQTLRTLQEWERLRLRVEPTQRHINFLADVVGDSCLPAGIDGDLIWRWESLAQSLDASLGKSLAQADAVTLAYRDLAALAAARPACILTHRSEAERDQNQPPRLCKTLTQWGISCEEVEPGDAIASLERDYFRTLLMHAGLSKFLWAGLDLVVVHLTVPAAATLSPNSDWPDSDWSKAYDFSDLETSDLETLDSSAEFVNQLPNLWHAAQGWWYTI